MGYVASERLRVAVIHGRNRVFIGVPPCQTARMFKKTWIKWVLIAGTIYCAATLAHLVAVCSRPSPTVEDFLNGKSDTLGGFDYAG